MESSNRFPDRITCKGYLQSINQKRRMNDTLESLQRRGETRTKEDGPRTTWSWSVQSGTWYLRLLGPGNVSGRHVYRRGQYDQTAAKAGTLRGPGGPLGSRTRGLAPCSHVLSLSRCTRRRRQGTSSRPLHGPADGGGLSRAGAAPGHPSISNPSGSGACARVRFSGRSPQSHCFSFKVASARRTYVGR